MKYNKAYKYLSHILKSSLYGSQKEYPKILSYLITNLCNSHCITCSVWKDKEEKTIDTSFLEKRLDDPIFKKIQHVGISGGEPSIFPKLKEHIKILIEKLPCIETLSITSNCIYSDFWKENLLDIYKLCQSNHIYFQINISVDGIGQMHDKIRGTKYNFENTRKVILFAKEKQIPFQIHTTINKYNVYHVNRILYFAQKINADIIFRLASYISRLDNKKQINSIALSPKQISFLCDFLSSDVLLEYTSSPGRRLFYHHLVKQLLGNELRTAPCYFKHEGLVLSSDGKLSYCSRFDSPFSSIYEDNGLLNLYKDNSLFQKCENGACMKCYHDQNGLWPLKDVIYEFIRKKNTKISKLIHISKFLFLAQCTHINNKATQYSTNNIKQIGIIGMYGGEHVGDAAILGGVISRVLQRYPSIQTITIYSFRKDRTLCWVNNLTELPNHLNLKVTDSIKCFTKELQFTQLLLWGGGPIMELPLVLSRNILFVKRALHFGCKFEIEGVGYGPINTWFGKWLSNQIFRLSNYTSLRTNKDIQTIEKLKLPYHNSKKINDPAFDYLRLLPLDLKIEPDEKYEIDRLLQKSIGHKIFIINIRPLWDRYGTNNLFNFDSFLDEIAQTINKLSEQNIHTLFVPMNADQFGFSDLQIAYLIQDKIKPNSFFDILELEPSINGLIYLLRKVDFSLCMRFHAAIFSISQGVKTFGIDYSLSGKGKVASLFEKENTSNCIHISQFNANDFIKLCSL